MPPEQTRRERFTAYTALLKERFDSGLLAELQNMPQWVVWKAELDGEGKRKKIPYNPNYRNARASVKIPKSWGSLETTLTALASGFYSGIGFMLTPPLVFLDLDHCVSKETGEITDPQAAEIVQTLNSYTETSPSGTGLHVLAYASLPGKNFHTAIELYGSNHFTTITTDLLIGIPAKIEHRQIEVAALYHQFAPPLPIPLDQNTRGGEAASEQLHVLPPEAATDRVLQRLLSGDMTGFPSQSSADFVLIMKLLHWTGDDTALTREIFLNSPLGQREKATRPTGEVDYTEMTINNVRRKRSNPPQRRSPSVTERS